MTRQERFPTQLYYYSANYRTPYGNLVYVNGVVRGTARGVFTTVEREARLRLAVDICANPKRKVARGIGGITVTRLEPIGEPETTIYG